MRVLEVYPSRALSLVCAVALKDPSPLRGTWTTHSADDTKSGVEVRSGRPSVDGPSLPRSRHPQHGPASLRSAALVGPGPAPLLFSGFLHARTMGN